MAYFFQHPVHTKNDIEFIGESVAEADETLIAWGFDEADTFNFVFEGYVFKKD